MQKVEGIEHDLTVPCPISFCPDRGLNESRIDQWMMDIDPDFPPRLLCQRTFLNRRSQDNLFSIPIRPKRPLESNLKQLEVTGEPSEGRQPVNLGQLWHLARSKMAQ